MDRFYLINYNRLFGKDTTSLIETYLNGLEPLEKIAHDILINDNRLLDNTIDINLMMQLLEKLEIDDIWYLASFPNQYNISKLAFQHLMCILDEYDVLHHRSLIRIMK